MVWKYESKMTTEELFGKRTVRSVWDLPANLNILLGQLGSYWDASQLINNNTMYPYYATFSLPKQAEQVRESMLDSDGSTIHTRIGVAASNVKLKQIFGYAVIVLKRIWTLMEKRIGEGFIKLQVFYMSET